MKKFWMACLLWVFYLPMAAPAAELSVWASEKGLTSIPSGALLRHWNDESGQEHHLTAEVRHAPRIVENADGEKSVRFERGSDPETSAWLSIPIQEEFRGATVFVVGRRLQRSPWMATAPGRTGSLRMHGGYAQWTGAGKGLSPPFGAVMDDEIHLCILRAEVNDAYKLEVSSWLDDEQTGSVVVDDPEDAVLFAKGQLGMVVDSFKKSFDFYEVLIYTDRMSASAFAQTKAYLLNKHGISSMENAPERPFGVPELIKESKRVVRPSVEPIQEGLKLWFDAETLADRLEDGAPVTQWSNRVATGPGAMAELLHAPRFESLGVGNRPWVVSTPDATAKQAQYMTIPIREEWEEITLVMVGSKLVQPGIFSTAPGTVGALRTYGVLQLVRGPAFSNPFPLLREMRQEGDLITATLGRDEQGAWHLRSRAHGVPQKEASGPGPEHIRMLNMHLGGTASLTHFSGAVSEVLIYDRVLSDGELDQTERYLAEKYQLPLGEKILEIVERAKKNWSDFLPQIGSEQSWLGNSFSSLDGRWVQSGIADLTVLPDGRAVAISVWDEPHKEIGFYKDGQPLPGKISGGGTAITHTDDYIYAAVSGLRGKYFGVRRLTLDGEPAPWQSLKDEGQIRVTTKEPWAHVGGLAVGNGRIFFTRRGLKTIYVFDSESGAELPSIEMKEEAKVLVFDPRGFLWAAVSDKVVEMDLSGRLTGRVLPFETAALSMDPEGHLVVADRGERHQVIFLDTGEKTPREIRTVGAPGGVWTAEPSGALLPDRIVNPNGVGVDAEGNVTVNGEGILRNFGPDGQLRWQLYCTEFTSCGDFDPAFNATRIYTGRHVYDYAPGAEPGGQDWKLTAFIGAREDTFRDKTAILRRWGDQLAHYTTLDPLQILSGKDEDGYTLQPSGLFFYQNAPRMDRPAEAPEEEHFFWVDENGDGAFQTDEFTVNDNGQWRGKSFHVSVDTDGGVWVPLRRKGLRYVPRSGFTAAGAPHYDLADMQILPLPAEFVSAERVYYYPETDTMILSGYTWEHLPLGAESWGNAGREIIRYERWSEPDQRRVGCRIPYPKEALDIRSLAVIPEENLLLAGEMKTMAILVYDLRSGKMLGVLQPDTAVVGPIGWLDINDGIQAAVHRSPGGDELVVQIEEVYYQKILVYRVKLPIR